MKFDLTGKRFGRLTVVRYNKPRWLCVCDCGKEKEILSGNLRSGDVQSCGCLFKEKITMHGMHDSPTYQTWEAIKQRCLNVKNTAYIYYGGRGIEICEKWMSFEGFLEDMGCRPDFATIDRIDPNGNYEKENCRWASKNTQQRNKRPQKNSPLGVAGVRETLYGAYQVRIKANCKEIHVGCFDNFLDAVSARKSAEIKYWSAAQ